MYICYRRYPGKTYSPTDYGPTTYSDVAVFEEELAGLRYANEHGLKLVVINDGETLEEADLRSVRPVQ